MKNTKTEVRFFTITEWEKEQDYLRQQHQKGWKFVRVNFIGLYHFEKCEPEDVIYQLDYNPEGLEHKEEYVQMFRDCGWEYLQDYVGYSYFRKAAALMDGEEEIFCDDASRADMMRRVFKGRMIPLFIVFFSQNPPFLRILQTARADHRFFPLLFISLYFCLLCSPFPAFLQIPARVTPILFLSVPGISVQNCL